MPLSHRRDQVWGALTSLVPDNDDVTPHFIYLRFLSPTRAFTSLHTHANDLRVTQNHWHHTFVHMLYMHAPATLTAEGTSGRRCVSSVSSPLLYERANMLQYIKSHANAEIHAQ